MKPYLRSAFSSQESLPPPTLGRALVLLMEHTKQRVRAGVRSPATLTMQESHVRWFLEQLGADLPLAELTSPRISALAERWLAQGGEDRGPISLKTLAKRLSTLRRAIRLAVQRGEIEGMPLFPEIGLPPMRPRSRIFKNFAELQRVVRALPRERADWVQVAVWSCQRPSDVERMRWDGATSTHVHRYLG